jgi:hypothetical protein
MHPAAVLDALVDGVGFVKSRATTFRGSHNAGATVVILAPATTTLIKLRNFIEFIDELLCVRVVLLHEALSLLHEVNIVMPTSSVDALGSG